MWMPAVASEGKLYERNALKFSAFIFCGTVSAQQMVFEEDAYFGYNSSAVRMFGSGYFYGSDQIFLSIGAQHADGQLAASQDNRLAQVFQHEAER